MKRFLLPLLAAIVLPIPLNAETYYKWHEDAMTDERYISIGLIANEGRPNGILRFWCWPDSPPNRYLRGALDVKHVIDNDDLTRRFGKEKAEYITWEIANNDKTRFYLENYRHSSTSTVQKYIQAAKVHSNMLIRYTSWINGKHTISFNLEELRPLILRAEQEGCDWNKTKERKKKEKKVKLDSEKKPIAVNCNSAVWKNKPRCKK